MFIFVVLSLLLNNWAFFYVTNGSHFFRCGQVFPDPIPIVCDLLSETLIGLDPSLPASIESYLQTVPSTLPALIELKKVGI